MSGVNAGGVAEGPPPNPLLNPRAFNDEAPDFYRVRFATSMGAFVIQVMKEWASLGSFSKILAPGIHLGWIQTVPGLRKRLLDNGFINSGGSISNFLRLSLAHYDEDGIREGIARTRPILH